MKKTIKKEFLFMAIGLFLVMVIGITVIIGEVTKIEQAEQLVTDGYISMEKYYGRVEKKIETCQKYANILTALSDEDMLIAGDISGNMETEEEAIAQYLTEMEKLTKDISEQSLTDSFMTYSSVNKELMEQLKECRQARDDGDIAKAKSIIGGSALEKIQARESACNDFQEKLDENVKRSSQNMKARTQKTYLISVTIGICFLIICLVTYILVNKAIIQPLKKASLQLNQMVEDIQNGNGDLSIRIPVKRMDEIGQLVTGVNLFVEKLQNIMKQLKDGSSDMDEVADKMNRQAGKVNEKAKVNFDSDENKATLKYSTVASGTDMSDPMQDITHHYTFGFDTLVNGTGSEKTTEITKYGVKTTTELDNKVALDGAQFKLFDANGKQLYFTSDGEYTTETSGTYDYIVSKNNGQLTATGLDAGTYTLKESKAPLGYALDKTTYTIVITPTYNELTGELKNYTVRVNGATGNSITFTHEKLDNGTINTTDNAANADTFGINNTPLITLPETGGAGMIALTVAAVVLMAGFGTMFVSLRKRKQVK